MVDTNFDPLSDEYLRDPARELRRAREVAPLHRVEAIDCWFAVGYDLVKELYTHPGFTNDQRAWKGWVDPEPGSVRAWTAEASLFAKTGAEHARTRRLASHAFTPAAVRRMRAQIAEVCGEYAAAISPETGTTVDLAHRYTRPIPNTVISRILGVPPLGADEERFRELAAAPLRLANPLAGPDERRRAENAAEELITYVRELVDDRREGRSGGDLVADLVAAYDADDALSDDEVVLIVFGLLAAGTDTTTFASTYGLRSLLRHPDQLERLSGEDDLLDNAVMELLRFEVGGGALPRFAWDDCEVAGREIEAGALVFLSPLGAHRDPEVFDDPDTLDLGRDTSDVMVFGHGPHYCLGANLAKVELAEIYRAALGFLEPGSEVIENEVTWTDRSVMFRSIDEMPVRL